MDRYWLLTWSTYGTWLPGDERGFVGPIDAEDGTWTIHNIPGTPYDNDFHNLHQYARTIMKGPPIFLTRQHATAVAKQFHETARARKWELAAFAVLSNHVHVVIGVIEDPEQSFVLRDFKSYASRSLNRRWTKPQSETWWTESGSKRKLPDEASIAAAVRYVAQQEHPHVVWVSEKFQSLIRPGERPA